jgi:hypothetical protein
MMAALSKEDMMGGASPQLQSTLLWEGSGHTQYQNPGSFRVKIM